MRYLDRETTEPLRRKSLLNDRIFLGWVYFHKEYLNIFYCPYLKSWALSHETWDKICLWFLQPVRPKNLTEMRLCFLEVLMGAITMSESVFLTMPMTYVRLWQWWLVSWSVHPFERRLNYHNNQWMQCWTLLYVSTVASYSRNSIAERGSSPFHSETLHYCHSGGWPILHLCSH